MGKNLKWKDFCWTEPHRDRCPHGAPHHPAEPDIKPQFPSRRSVCVCAGMEGCVAYVSLPIAHQQPGSITLQWRGLMGWSCQCLREFITCVFLWVSVLSCHGNEPRCNATIFSDSPRGFQMAAFFPEFSSLCFLMLILISATVSAAGTYPSREANV